MPEPRGYPACERVFRADDGVWYRATLALSERPTGGVAPHIQSLCFTSGDGQWIGSVPLLPNWTTISLDVEELQAMLALARLWR